MSDIIIPESPSRRGVLRYLREKYPDKEWRAVREGFGWGYETADGWNGGWRSCLAPLYDGDDETSVLRFFIYKPNAPTEEVFFV